MKEILKKHRQSFTALGYSEEQADDLIHRISKIMLAFIEAAWGLHPAQLAKQAGVKKSLPVRGQCAKIGTKAKQTDREDSAGEAADG
ncbi:hypothetical protein JCM17846_28630 [Iodidimonas nitroreducens]|uniref:Uncharacterized protein n=1 Tax=Iodidimonas nitroreducens TaxID=1236968 RepID=A0A5A7N9Y7_9PROT|nr:hypothetical protein [Iodidimonas nitroreducens]GAK34637.1 hypothetical protein AQ1_02536 [alpha proteobacterium Q-1]GER05181.1 hypothetical protein JCM17846_28630 [Iodidimonas nitroreducens]